MWVIKLVITMLFVLNTAEAIVVDATTTAILVEDTNSNDPYKLRQAFAQILAINTGEDIVAILQHPVFEEARIKAGVKRSYFERIESKYLLPESSYQYWFHVVMEKSFIKKIIKRAGFSILPHDRKAIMLWVVKETQISEEINEGIDTTDKKTMMHKSQELDYAYDDEVLMYWFNHWAQALGLVVVFPNIDEQDKLLVTRRSIKTLSFEAIDQTIKRYNLDQSLLIYIKKDENSLKLRSGLTLGENDMSIKHFQEQLVDEGIVLYSLMADVVQKFSQVYKIDSDKLQEHTVSVVFENIESYDKVGKIRQYLTNLSVIESFEIIAASQGSLQLKVELIINTSEFLKIIARDQQYYFNHDSPINQLIFNTQKL